MLYFPPFFWIQVSEKIEPITLLEKIVCVICLAVSLWLILTVIVESLRMR